MKHLLSPTADQLLEAFTDITAPVYGVELVVNQSTQVVHVNVDGVCVLRICRIPMLSAVVDGQEGGIVPEKPDGTSH